MKLVVAIIRPEVLEGRAAALNGATLPDDGDRRGRLWPVPYFTKSIAARIPGPRAAEVKLEIAVMNRFWTPPSSDWCMPHQRATAARRATAKSSSSPWRTACDSHGERGEKHWWLNRRLGLLEINQTTKNKVIGTGA